jgi:predicted regulator of Ras-like GTPase activity (Roadblock/LC7/MglB family)
MTSKIITAEQSQALKVMLESLLNQAKSEAVFVCDKGGNIIDSVSKTPSESEFQMAALAAGSFAATSELAKLIGEPGFRSVYHRGEVASIFMQGLGEGYLMFIVFGKKTTIGMVKLHVEQALVGVCSILEKITGQTIRSVGMNTTFVMNEIGGIFSSDEDEDDPDEDKEST